MEKTKFKPGDRILYKHPDDSYALTATIMSIGDEDNYWIKWDDTEHFTENPIDGLDNDKNIHPLTEATRILYGT